VRQSEFCFQSGTAPVNVFASFPFPRFFIWFFPPHVEPPPVKSLAPPPRVPVVATKLPFPVHIPHGGHIFFLFVTTPPPGVFFPLFLLLFFLPPCTVFLLSSGSFSTASAFVLQAAQSSYPFFLPSPRCRGLITFCSIGLNPLFSPGRDRFPQGLVFFSAVFTTPPLFG